ncbi:SusC/RagA family TonB-linked outer membrane protein [Pontibacter diazotrophicus]|uniref:SusC/RagA family TonB-linked outer membrane protein n=1 Tax=Pontibacter diazotrophicus TaxID=1400979 RepID=A0A3D8L7V4_9BACT|nr:SusC/RagA family TonB-linked outer membrane protein [Pontibacter diazotrophicus]RDV13478.1 SusC/RagA family TonB-linked outer membrane protein [Pontibacter diazotrophicus]
MNKTLLAVMVIWLLHSSYAVAQSRMVSGTVTSQEDDLPLPGVSVVLKGTTKGIVTGIEGEFNLSVPEEGSTLVFSFIGMLAQEVPIGNQAAYNVVMAPDSRQLSEVVVTAFGIEREKKALGYTMQEVSGEELTEVKTANVVNNLSGRVAGVQVSSNGGPGSSSNIIIRGMGSVSRNNQPLVVVDGVPLQQSNDNRYGGGISEINPDNIASMSILKGPNAAALYGSRAANGVILITTKNGSGTLGIGVEISSSATFERPLVKPDFQNIYGGGNGYRTWYTNGRSGAITDPLEIDQYRDAYGPNAPLSGTAGTDESWGAPMDGRLVRQWWTGTDVAPLTPQPDNWDEFWDTGQTFFNSVALTGGNDKGSFRLSVGRLDQKGIMYNNDFKRNNFSINSAYNLTPKLKAVVSGEYVESGSDNRSYQSGQQFIWSHRHVSWERLKNWRDYEDVHIQRSSDNLPPNWQHTYFTNPFYSQEFLTYGNAKDRLRGNASLTYDFNDKLSLMVRSGTDFWTDTRINVNAWERVSNGNPLYGAYSEEVIRNQESNHDAILSYKQDITPDFSFNAQAGGVYRSNYFKRNYAAVTQLVIDGLYTLDNNAVPNTNQSAIEEFNVQSLFGAAQFSFRDALFLDVTGRNDWSSTLPASNNSFFYPSVSVSAVVTDLLNLNSNLLSFAKVRASWAQVGNDADPYQLYQLYNAQTPWDGSLPAFGESTDINNANLKPEITTGQEFGFDLRFLDGRIGLDATYYSQNTEDQILGVEISKASGYNRRFLNAGEVTNKGVEVMVSGTPVQLGNGLQWDVSLNYARNRSMVVELAEGLTTYTLHATRGMSSEARVGQPYGTFYGTAFQRSPEGDLVFKDGRPQVASGQQVLGNIQPDWIGGMSNTLSFKGITLSALVDVRAGGDIFDEGTGTARWTGQYAETAVGREEGVIGKGVKNVGSEEAPVYVPNDVIVDAKLFYSYNNPRTYHESAIIDATYVKLREVSLGYEIPTFLTSKIKAQSARISFVGRNLAILFRNNPHIDPEIDSQGGNAQGFTYGQLPNSRSLGVNLDVKF